MLLPEERRGRARLVPPASSTRALRRPTHMLDRHDVLDSMLREIRITRHLVEKVPPGGMDLRPTPGQRSTLELLLTQSVRLQGLNEELREARQALDERKQVERAKQQLMRQQGFSEGEAYSWLRQAAMNQGLRLEEVAQRLLSLAQPAAERTPARTLGQRSRH